MKPRVLVVGGSPEQKAALSRELGRTYECGEAPGPEEVLTALNQKPWQVALVDCDPWPGHSGLEVLQSLREASPRTFRVLITRHTLSGWAVDISRLGQPHAVVDARDSAYLVTLMRTLEALLSPPPPEPPDVEPPRTPWVAHAPASIEFIGRLRDLAESDRVVFLHGENGSEHSRAAAILRTWRIEWQARGARRRTRAGVTVAVLRVPSLRERPQDLPGLARECLLEFAAAQRQPAKQLAPGMLTNLMQREWFGNVAELQATLWHACKRAGGRPLLSPEDLPQSREPAPNPSQVAKDHGQIDCMLRQLRTAGHVTGAAKLEGCTRANYIRMMRRLGLLRADVTTDSESAEAPEGGAAPNEARPPLMT